MTKGPLYLGLLVFLIPVCFGQGIGKNTAVVRKIKVAPCGNNMKIEVTLTSHVVPTVMTATNPDRLVVELPNTAVNAKQERIEVNQDGIEALRIGLNNGDPPITRVVVDLTRARPFGFTSGGNTITLTVLPPPAATQTNGQARAAAPAASGSMIGKLWGKTHQETSANTTSARVVKFPVRASTTKTVADEEPKQGFRTVFRVKYVADGAAYLNGGRSSGLSEGMTLIVRNEAPSPASAGNSSQEPAVAELRVVSVAQTSAVAEIRAPKREVKHNDWAYLSTDDAQRATDERFLNTSAAAPGTNAFVDSNPFGAKTPNVRRPSAEPGRIRLRVGLDYSGIQSSGSTVASSSARGLIFQSDVTHIAGTYWNLQGYWRGRLTNSSQPDEQTMQDYLDKTYTLQLFYENPNSKWLAGVGRLYLPWAPSLDTIDGGYIGRRVASHVIAGVFGGSTPDPTSWHYSPDRQITGSFVNFEGGDYEAFHYTSTAGVALSMLKWALDRPYVFFEDGLSYKRFISVYHSLIVDSPQGVSTDGIKPGTGISRSYLTFHIQPERWISFDVYHNYFRDVPTAATQLIGTGLVDKLLYQGVNAGVRVEPVKHFSVYTTIGQSDRTGDVKRSLNQMYGATWSDIWRSGIRADAHYSKFDSSFARGDYRVLSLSRHLGERVMWDAQVGSQNLASAYTLNNRSMFVDTSFDTNLWGRSFLQSGYTISRGVQLNYDQWYVSLGYRFDVRDPGK
jgi:hypothetical protein